MTQPFRRENSYQSVLWSGLKLSMLENRIEVRVPYRVHTLSSAIHPGGFSTSDRIINWKVPLNYDGEDPIRDIIEKCTEWDCDPNHTIGLITAAKLTHASIEERAGDRFNLLCCVTVGTRNAARSGMPRPAYQAYKPGTINTIILIDGQMTESAMVNTIITATEAKSAALQELGIIEHERGHVATGTTTDAIVIGVSQSEQWKAVHAYAGPATTIGCTIGEAVYAAVLEAGLTQHEE